MTVVHKPYIIIDIIPMQKAEVKILGKVFQKNPDLDMFRIVAVTKGYIEKTEKGRKLLADLGQGEHTGKLNDMYLEYAEAFTVYIPMTSKTIEYNNYHLGGEIMVAYYPTNVWATFHCEGEKDNNNDKKHIKGD